MINKRHSDKGSGPVAALVKRKYLIFRPYVDPMNFPPAPPPDKGYYYIMHHSDVKLIKFILEDNGFCKLPTKETNWSFMWHGGPPKSAIY
jgi:hypothetical protein